MNQYSKQKLGIGTKFRDVPAARLFQQNFGDFCRIVIPYVCRKLLRRRNGVKDLGDSPRLFIDPDLLKPEMRGLGTTLFAVFPGGHMGSLV
jgi:hypothetical protein